LEYFATKSARYASIARRLEALLAGERDFLANTANTAALIFELGGDLNWAGFYFLQGEELVLGPFQGRTACVRIAMGTGVCGTAARNRETLVVPNVHQFEGHIACDAASNAEIVVPLLDADQLLGVMDLDSPTVDRFDEEDRSGVEELARIYLRSTDLSPLRAMVEGI
jgi:L-methionine (R)-S-oxide reductase